MALIKQLVALPIDQGLDTKLDPKQQEVGYLRKAENVVYETLKLLRKRNGYDLAALDALDGSEISEPEVLARYNNELALLTNSDFYALSETLQKWVRKGTVYPIQQTSEIIVKNANEQVNVSGALVQGLYVSAWEDSSGGVRYSVRDLNNESFLVADSLVVGGLAERPIVVSIVNSVYIFYAIGSNLEFKKFNILQPATLSAAIQVATNVDTTAPVFDAHSSNNTIIVGYNSTVVGAKLGILTINQLDNISSVLNLSNSDASFALDVTTDPNSRVLLAWSSGVDVRYAVYSLALTSALRVPTLVEAVADCVNLTMVATTTDAQYRLYYEIAADQASDHFIKIASTPLSGAVSGIQNFAMSLGLAGTGFLYNGTRFVPCVHGSELQPTFFLLDENGAVASKYFNQEAGGLLNSGVLPHVQIKASDEFLFPCAIKSRLAGETGTFYSTLGAAYQIIDFTPRQDFQTSFLAENLHVCAGLLKMYDGATLVEHGFNVFPENLQQVQPIGVSVEVTQEGSTGVEEQQTIFFSAVPTIGTFTLGLGSETTSPLPFNASTTSIKSALEALSAVNTVTVTGSFAAGISVAFNSPIQSFPVLSVTNSTLAVNAVSVSVEELTQGVAQVKEIFRLDFSGTPNDGSFQVDIGGNLSTPILFSDAAAAVKTAIQNIAGIITVTVTGSFALGFQVVVDLPIQGLPAPTIANNTLNISGVPVVVYPSVTQEGVTGVAEVQRITFSSVPDAGAYVLNVGGNNTSSLAFNADNATIKTAIDALASVTTSTVTGSYATGLTITIDSPVQPFALITLTTNTLTSVLGTPISSFTQTITPGVIPAAEIQTLSFSEAPASGFFKLKLGSETTTTLNSSSTAAAIETALEALTAIINCTVTGSFSSGFTITFIDPLPIASPIEIVENSLAPAAPVVGNMSDGNYGYLAVYRWTDNTGRDHRSAPSPLPLTVILSGGSDTQGVRVRVPTLRVTEKENVVIELYRTEDAGTTYYKVTNDLAPIFNNKMVNFVDIDDTIADEALISREILYTTGGVIENISPGSCNLLTVFNNRIAYVGELENRVYFSKIVQEGQPVQFTDILFQDFDPIGGPIRAIIQMNDKLVVFEEDACFYIGGDPANNVNQQSTLTLPEIISTDIGCIDTNSVVLTPGGIMFKSRKGIWLLGTGLNLQYIGDKVEEFNGSTITSAQIVGELNQIRFTTSNEIALVYNYDLNRWATFTNHGARSAVVINNDYYYLREDGQLYKENRSRFSDASSPIKMRVETGWLSFNTLQGFQRVYKAMILGSYKSQHLANIKVAYDFIEAWTQSEVVNPANFASDTRYGQDATYGSGSPYGGNGNLYQIRLDLARQKCQSIKLQFEDAQDQVGEGLSLSSITLQVGGKQGVNKLGTSNQFGTSGE